MRKFLFALLVLVMSAALGLFCAACSQTDGGKEPDLFSPATEQPVYPTPAGYSNDVYVIRQDSLTAAELETAVCIQGLAAKQKASVYIRPTAAEKDWLAPLTKTYGLNVHSVDGIWELAEIFRDSISGQKYVLYNSNGESGISMTDQTVNYATAVSAAEGYLMVSAGLEGAAQNFGLTLGKDVRSENTRSVFETYKDKLTKSVLVHQSPQKAELRDYAIALGAMCFYSDYYDGDSSVKDDILSWADDNIPVLGWTENEINFVSSNSLHSKITLAADWCLNLTFYSAFKEKNLKPYNYEPRQITAEQGKHYLAIVMSDGDNLQWMQNGFATDKKYFGSPYRGDFPMTWTIAPGMIDLSPAIMEYIYDNGSEHDQFIAGPSGVGYVNAADYNRDSLAAYAGITAGYNQRTGIDCVNFLDNYIDEDAMAAFAAHDSVKGGVWSVGNMYIEGGGGVYWQNDKPFITIRETLWRIAGNDSSNAYYGFVERVAQRINAYSTDCTDIAGYTVLIAHAWSIGSMDYINRFVSHLDDHVELVTVGEMIDLVSRNVPHKDVYFPDDIQPEDIKDLATIESEQLTAKELSGIQTETLRTFLFDEGAQNLGGWTFGNGGLQYDSAAFTGNSIKLDGSDLNDYLDPMPNSWAVNKFTLGQDDRYFTVFATCPGGSDVNYRVRVIEESGGKLTSSTLTSGNYEKEPDMYGWYKMDSSSPLKFVYDLSQFAGKTVYISVEQDDTGDGDGEVVEILRMYLSSEPMDVSAAFPKWDPSDIVYDWTRYGKVASHNEGACLEADSGASGIGYKYTVTEDTKYLKFYVRIFVRTDRPQDTPPQLRLTVNGQTVRAMGESGDTCTVSTDEYRCIVYDLTQFVGEQVEVRFTSLEGDHAAIGKIIAAEGYSQSELTAKYTKDALAAL